MPVRFAMQTGTANGPIDYGSVSGALSRRRGGAVSVCRHLLTVALITLRLFTKQNFNSTI